MENKFLFEDMNICEVTNYNNNNKFARFGWQNNFDDNRSLIQYGYISGFKDAADTIVNSKSMEYYPDRLMFPVFFCYRQHLELMLKNIYRAGLNNDAKYKASISHIGHNLKMLWEKSKPFIIIYINRYTPLSTKQKNEFISFLKNAVFLFNDLDSYSFNFRYPEDKDLNQSIKQDYIGIDFVKMMELIDAIDELMCASYDYILDYTPK